jgi:putative flippase GtrA
MVRSLPIRYLVVGAFNTVIGYCLGVGLYYLLSPAVHVLAIGAIANVIAISVSFTTYKLFVFRTRERWLEEYLRSYVVYGGMALVSIVALWVLVDAMRLPIWLAQAMSIIITIVISYLGHSRYTFGLATDAEAGQSK